MHLILLRLASGEDSTIGALLNGDTGHCFGLVCEDEYRKHKVAGETRIPSGTYEIKLRSEGGMIKRYREIYGDWHSGMIHLQNVPNFKYVYIHHGNTDDHTDGCPLLGYGASLLRYGRGGSVSRSRDAYRDFAKIVIPKLLNNEFVNIKVINSITEIDL